MRVVDEEVSAITFRIAHAAKSIARRFLMYADIWVVKAMADPRVTDFASDPDVKKVVSSHSRVATPTVVVEEIIGTQKSMKVYRRFLGK